MKVHQSKRGFHPCSLEEKEKLRKFRYLLQVAYCDYLRAMRFCGKSWRNRTKNFPTMPVCLLTVERENRYSFQKNRLIPAQRSLSFFPTMLHGKHSNLFFRVDEAYQSARFPVAREEDVKPLSLPSDWLHIFAALETCYKSEAAVIRDRSKKRTVAK